MDESRKNVSEFMEMIAPFLKLNYETICTLEDTLNKICAIAYARGISEGISFSQKKMGII